jgi:predicted peptidase
MKTIHKYYLVGITLFYLMLPFGSIEAQNLEDEFDKRTYVGSSNISLRYRFHTPPNISDANKIPLIVFLHGSGGWGQNNEAQLRGGNRHGLGLWLHDEIASKHPAYILAPQLSYQRWANPDSLLLAPHSQTLLELIAFLENEYQIDEERIYLLGQSLGGAGVWDLVSKHPDRFAAAVPVCGFGNIELVERAREVPIWAFHGELDTTVPVQRSRELVSLLRELEGNIRYTEYSEVGHASWIRAFAEPELPNWLFSQSLDKNN